MSAAANQPASPPPPAEANPFAAPQAPVHRPDLGPDLEYPPSIQSLLDHLDADIAAGRLEQDHRVAAIDVGSARLAALGRAGGFVGLWLLSFGLAWWAWVSGGNAVTSGRLIWTAVPFVLGGGVLLYVLAGLNHAFHHRRWLSGSTVSPAATATLWLGALRRGVGATAWALSVPAHRVAAPVWPVAPLLTHRQAPDAKDAAGLSSGFLACWRPGGWRINITPGTFLEVVRFGRMSVVECQGQMQVIHVPTLVAVITVLVFAPMAWPSPWLIFLVLLPAAAFRRLRAHRWRKLVVRGQDGRWYVAWSGLVEADGGSIDTPQVLAGPVVMSATSTLAPQA